MSEPLLQARNLVKRFAVQRGLLRRAREHVHAVDHVDVDVGAGETLACVGESGSGKSTLGRLLLRLVEPDEGTVRVFGPAPGQERDVLALHGEPLRRLRRELQIVFQDPYSSLNPRMRVVDLVGEGLRVHQLARPSELRARVGELLARVGLDDAALDRFPHEFSGGQRQRIGIARALAVEPRFLVLDEAVSALDVSVAAQILNLLADLRRDLRLAYFFITHDLNVVRHLADRVLVLYLGERVESAPASALFQHPRHPYTRALLAAAPARTPAERRRREQEERRTPLKGDPPSPLHPPSGCRFHPRCPLVRPECATVPPPPREVAPGHVVRCHVDL